MGVTAQPKPLSGQSVLVVEDHKLVADMMVQWVLEAGATACEAAHSAEEARAYFTRMAPTLVLCDIVLGSSESGIELVRDLSPRGSSMFIMVSAERDSTSVQEAFAAGAKGFVSKASSSRELVDAIAEVLAGQVEVADRGTMRVLLDAFKQARQKPAPLLTPRELEVLQCMSDGTTTNASLAAALTISQSSVRSHIENLMRKLGVNTRAAALAKAHKEKLIR